jgi:hypothetical protein
MAQGCVPSKDVCPDDPATRVAALAVPESRVDLMLTNPENKSAGPIGPALLV